MPLARVAIGGGQGPPPADPELCLEPLAKDPPWALA